MELLKLLQMRAEANSTQKYAYFHEIHTFMIYFQ